MPEVLPLPWLPWEQIGKILLAALLGAIAGAERDIMGRPAGLRTNMLIAMSACLFTILSKEAFPESRTLDPSRIAAGIVTGVGFLGAGVLIHYQNGDGVRGLTTAADIWMVAAIGMAIGVGMFTLGIFVTLFTVIALVLLAPLSHRIEGAAEKKRRWLIRK